MSATEDTMTLIKLCSED